MTPREPAAAREADGPDDRAGAAASRIAEIADRLEAAHGTPSKTRREPLDELVLTILSQNTSDTNRDRAWDRLRERFPDWDAVRRAGRDAVEDAIRPGGLAGQKAAAIQGMLDRLHEERGEVTLEHLRAMEADEAMGYLTGFRRVGTKTAACVLAFSLRRPVMPVDTHVDRVSRRLGLVPPGGGAEAAHRVLNRSVPADRRLPLHLLMIRHGRATCGARSPACDACCLADLCPRVGVEGSA